MGVCVAAAALGLSVRVEAQSAPAAQGTVELPAVTVTAASPVAKPKKKAKRSSPPASAPASDDTAAAAPPVAVPELQPLPGAIVDDQAFVAVTVATARELEANAGQTLTDTLMLKPGISGSTFAPGANRPIIRGLDNYRVRIQENGIATHDVSDLSEDHAIPIDPFSADQVEVVRGPATLRYGSQAIGGVVDATNNRIPSFVPMGGISAEVKGGITSVDDGRDGAFQVTAGAGSVALHADAFKRTRRRLRHAARHAAQLVRRKRWRRCRRLRSSAPMATSASRTRALRASTASPAPRPRDRARPHRSGAGQDLVEGRVAAERQRRRSGSLLVRLE